MQNGTIQISKRRFLSLAGASALAPLMAACGGTSGPVSSPISPTGSASQVNITPTGAAAKALGTTSTASANTITSTTPTITWTKGIGPALNMTGLVQTFDSTFATADDLRKITVNGAGGPWYAPIHATSGAARFASPMDPVSPFAIADGHLRIRCEQVDGVWQTGHMQTCDLSGTGFAQRRGYFEIRCKMPAAGTMGAWPAFWMYSRTFFTDPNLTRAELDVIEYYPGHDGRGHHAAVHLRPGTRPKPKALQTEWSASCYNGLDALLDGQWHTYGVEITADWIIVYFDRVELKRIPTLPEFDAPLFMLVSLQLLPEEVPSAVAPIDFYVDYVRAWQRI